MPDRSRTIPSRATCQRVYNACVRPFLQVEDCGLRPAPATGWSCPTGLQTVEVAYELDVDSFNGGACDCVGRFHRWTDSSSHLPQHAHDARGRVVVSRRREPAYAARTDGTAGESQPAHGAGLGFRSGLRSSVAGARRNVYLSGTERSAVTRFA